jgi:hypothetical protein
LTLSSHRERGKTVDDISHSVVQEDSHPYFPLRLIPLARPRVRNTQTVSPSLIF